MDLFSPKNSNKPAASYLHGTKLQLDTANIMEHLMHTQKKLPREVSEEQK